MVSVTVNIRESKFHIFADKFDKLARKGKKLGCPDIRYEILETADEKIEGTTPTQYRRYHTIRVTGETPKYNGFRFVAVVEHTENGNLLWKKTDDVSLKDFRYVEKMCDHCRTVRNRRQTFIVAAEQDKILQVGSTCIKDFTGHANPLALAKYLEHLLDLEAALRIDDDEDDYAGGYANFDSYFDTVEVLAVAHKLIKAEGYFKNNPDGMRTTKEDLCRFFFPVNLWAPKEYQEEVKRFKRVWEPDAEDVSAAREHRKAILDLDVANDYEHNVKVSATGDSVGSNSFGFLASYIAKRLQAEEKTLLKTKVPEIDETKSKYFGVIGERSDYEFTLLKSLSFEGEWGVSYLYKFIDDNGNIAVWWASRRADCKVGERYKVRATIKDHTEYREIKQTKLTRCSIKD